MQSQCAADGGGRSLLLGRHRLQGLSLADFAPSSWADGDKRSFNRLRLLKSDCAQCKVHALCCIQQALMKSSWNRAALAGFCLVRGVCQPQEAGEEFFSLGTGVFSN
jgi:hypothetical protein